MRLQKYQNAFLKGVPSRACDRCADALLKKEFTLQNVNNALVKCGNLTNALTFFDMGEK